MPDPPTPDEIKAARRRLGLTQVAFAARVGCHWRAVNNWETGKKRPTGLYLVALRRVLAAGDQDERSEER